MGQFVKHVFVCTSGKVCPRQGSLDVLVALRKSVRELRGGSEIRVNKCGCMAQCGYGPMVVVHPEDTWYAGVRADDVPELLNTHLLGGVPVDRLVHRPPGPGKQICPTGSEPIPPDLPGP